MGEGAPAPRENNNPRALKGVPDGFQIRVGAAATAAYHRTRDQQRVPMGVVDRLIARENPIRIWREHRGHSLRQLAERAGVGIGYLSQIENGERKGTVGTLKKIAAALDVDLDDLT